MKRYVLASAVALLVALPWLQTVRAGAPLYTVQNLGTFNGEVPSISGINGSGQVAGNASANGSQALRYTDGLGWQALPGLNTTFSVATGINASGDLVGYHFNSLGQLRAYRYRDGIGVEDIAPLAGDSMTLGFGINDAGDVVGMSMGAALTPFRAAVGLLPVALPQLPGGGGSACGINQTGQVVGTAMATSGAQHAMRVDPGAASVIDIASISGDTFAVSACAIDATGRVGGQMNVTGGFTHALGFTDTAGVRDLDTFNSPFSNIESVAAGVSAGWYMLSDSTTHAFANTDADGSFDLNTRIDAPGWVLQTARAINGSGVIAGEGQFNGGPAVYLLTPQESKDSTPPVINSVTASPSSIYPPKGQMVPVTITVDATDDSGQAPACTLTSITGPGAPGTDFSITGPLAGSVVAVSGRTYTFHVTCVDAAGNSASGSTDVTVVPDTTAPVIASVAALPNNLWPPDDRLVPVTVTVSATDDVDSTPACALTSVTGVVAADDAAITGPLAVTLRATGGRTYTLTVRCADSAGNASTASTKVVVPADVTDPTIVSLSAEPGSIWPANNKMVPVSISVSATDDVDASPVCSLTGVTGGPAADWALTGPFSASVRATKDTAGALRTYLFHVSCRDRAGNTSLGAVSVSVGKDVTPTVYHYNRRLRRFINGLAHAYGRDRR